MILSTALDYCFFVHTHVTDGYAKLGGRAFGRLQIAYILDFFLVAVCFGALHISILEAVVGGGWCGGGGSSSRRVVTRDRVVEVIGRSIFGRLMR